MDSCPLETVQVVAVTLIHLWTGCFVSKYGHLTSVLLGWIVGGTLVNSSTLGMHESAHGLVWGRNRKTLNEITGIIASVPLILPAFFPFRHFHLIHHKNTNVDGKPPVDPDMPTVFEHKLFNSNIVGRWCGMLLQPIAYSLRPTIQYGYNIGAPDVVNGLFNFLVHFSMFYWLGPCYLSYIVSSVLLGLSFHPLAMHFYAEHSGLDEKSTVEAKQPCPTDTWSYYGPWNYFIFFVGYHKEHHDNVGIAGWYLPEFKRKNIAKYCTNEAVYESYNKIFFDLFFKRVDIFRNRNCVLERKCNID